MWVTNERVVEGEEMRHRRACRVALMWAPCRQGLFVLFTDVPCVSHGAWCTVGLCGLSQWENQRFWFKVNVEKEGEAWSWNCIRNLILSITGYFKGCVGDWTVTPEDGHGPNSQNLWILSYTVKQTVQVGLSEGSWSGWGEIIWDYPGRLNVITGVLATVREEVQSGKRRWSWMLRLKWCGLRPWNQGSL